jgi:hypothetical protein
MSLNAGFQWEVKRTKAATQYLYLSSFQPEPGVDLGASGLEIVKTVTDRGERVLFADLDRSGATGLTDLQIITQGFGSSDVGDIDLDSDTDGADFLAWQREAGSDNSKLKLGDFNFDGRVDSRDLGDWRSAFGKWAGADADKDGDSDGKDFLSWQRRFGDSAANSTSVPEPTHRIAILLGFSAHRIGRRTVGLGVGTGANCRRRCAA